MHCYYIFDKEAGRVLIPGCYQGLYNETIEECHCRAWHKECRKLEAEKNSEVDKIKRENKVLRNIP